MAQPAPTTTTTTNTTQQQQQPAAAAPAPAPEQKERALVVDNNTANNNAAAAPATTSSPTAAPATTTTNNTTTNDSSAGAAAPAQEQQQQPAAAPASTTGPTEATAGGRAASPAAQKPATTSNTSTGNKPAGSSTSPAKPASQSPAKKPASASPSGRTSMPQAAGNSKDADAKAKRAEYNNYIRAGSKKSNNSSAANSPEKSQQNANNGNGQPQTPQRENPALADRALAERLGRMTPIDRVREGERILKERMRQKYGKGSPMFRSHTERTSLSAGPRRSEAPSPQALKSRQADEERRQAIAKKFDLDPKTLTAKNDHSAIHDPNAIGNKKVSCPKWTRSDLAKLEIQKGRKIPIKTSAPGPGAYADPLAWLGGVK